jgi:hypothetical protein
LGYLPVAAITAASASAAASATTVAASTTTAPTSVATIASPSAAPTTATFSLRASFVDNQSAAEKVLSVQCSDGFFGFRIITDFSETKASRLSCKTIAKQS